MVPTPNPVHMDTDQVDLGTAKFKNPQKTLTKPPKQTKLGFIPLYEKPLNDADQTHPRPQQTTVQTTLLDPSC